MPAGKLKKFLPSTGTLICIGLIGLLLLSALLYYQAVKIQRFLEPALAISQSRINLASKISRLFADEFGMRDVKGIGLTTDSILVEESLFFADAHNRQGEGSVIIKKLSKVLLTALKDPDIRSYIDLVMVSTKNIVDPGRPLSEEEIIRRQLRTELIMQALYKAEPGLEEDFSGYFAGTTINVHEIKNKARWVEFRFVPTERMHIDVLQRLRQYAS